MKPHVEFAALCLLMVVFSQIDDAHQKTHIPTNLWMKLKGIKNNRDFIVKMIQKKHKHEHIGMTPHLPYEHSHNVARNSLAHQSSTAARHKAEHAVDGNQTTCSQTLHSQYHATWTTDLRQRHTVVSLKISTGSRPIQNLNIYVGDAGSITKDRLCRQVHTLSGRNFVVNCSSPLRGQKVTLSTWKQRLHLCEVEVNECDNGYFGPTCELECHCYGNRPCDKMDGTCSVGCAIGWQGRDCQISITPPPRSTYSPIYKNGTGVVPATTPAPDPMEKILFTKQGSLIPNGLDIVAGLMAEPAGCTPMLKEVKIEADDPDMLFYPTCTTIEQCGGCCGHDMLECAPSEEQAIPIQVMKARYPYPGAEFFEFEGLDTKYLKKHLKCECRCRVQPHHCTTKQNYVGESCRCQCKNENEATSCPSHQQWDAMKCQCVCPQIYPCHEDEAFNNKTCRCEAISQGSDIGKTDPCAEHKCLDGYRLHFDGYVCKCLLPANWDSLPGKIDVELGTTREPDVSVITQKPGGIGLPDGGILGGGGGGESLGLPNPLIPDGRVPDMPVVPPVDGGIFPPVELPPHLQPPSFPHQTIPGYQPPARLPSNLNRREAGGQPEPLPQPHHHLDYPPTWSKKNRVHS